MFVSVSEVIEKWSCLVGAQHSFTHMPRRSEAPINKKQRRERENDGAQLINLNTHIMLAYE